MSEYRVAILGNGGIFKLAHGPAWKRIPRAKVVATCDVVEERAVEAAREFDGAQPFTRAEDLLKRDGIDIVDICTPSDTHAPLAIQALEAGKHVICEKPMALRPSDSSRLMEVAAARKRHLFIGHTRRFDRRWVQLKEQIASGRIGEPVAVRRSERCWGGFPSSQDWHWNLEQSGGVLMDLGIHIADFFAWLLGGPVQSVYARALKVREEARETGCFDFALVQMGFPGGKRGLMEVSWTHPAAYAPFYSATEVIGTRGKLTLTDKGTAPLTVVKKEIGVPRYSTLLSSFPDTFVEELGHFLDCMEGAARPRIKASEAHQAVRVVDAAFRSIASGQPVSLP